MFVCCACMGAGYSLRDNSLTERALGHKLELSGLCGKHCYPEPKSCSLWIHSWCSVSVFVRHWKPGPEMLALA